MSSMDAKGVCRNLKSQGMLKMTLVTLVLVLVLQLYSNGHSRIVDSVSQIHQRPECDVKDDDRRGARDGHRDLRHSRKLDASDDTRREDMHDDSHDDRHDDSHKAAHINQQEGLAEAKRLLLPRLREELKPVPKVASDKHTSSDPGKKQVLLISYGRTGTTYTSAVISHNSDVFYTAEPLHRMPPQYGIYERPLPERTRLKAVDTIRAFLECDLLSIDPVVYSSIVFNASNSTKGFRTCISKTLFKRPKTNSRRRGTKLVNVRPKYPHKKSRKFVDPLYYVRCFLTMWKSCKKSHVTYVKTIRVRMWWARQLLEQFPHLKVLYLIRDPRATLYSQSANFGNFELDSTATTAATSFCADVRDDLGHLANLSASYPGRLMALRYEDGATQPMQFAKNIYQFLGFNYDQSIQDFVSEIASSSKSARELKQSNYGYEKKNSTQTMNRWRLKAQFSTVLKIDHVCKDLYHRLGYEKINTTNQLFSSLPLTKFGPFQGMFSSVPFQPT